MFSVYRQPNNPLSNPGLCNNYLFFLLHEALQDESSQMWNGIHGPSICKMHTGITHHAEK